LIPGEPEDPDNVKSGRIAPHNEYRAIVKPGFGSNTG
jgi:hypothetical protein